jgi:hypothetical protein
VRRAIEQLTSQLFNLPPAKPGTTEDVHLSLGLWRPHRFSLDMHPLNRAG